MMKNIENKKGFIFIETIITVVVLITTLVFLYSSYSSVVTVERKRLYHDDIAYIYKTKYIADVLKETINETKFNDAVNNSFTGAQPKYLYLFNTESKIYNDNHDITQAKSLYHIYRLIYIKISDIPNLKKCLNGNDNGARCQYTKIFTKSYGYGYLDDYLKTLDVPSEEGKDGILISLIYETKNGNIQEYDETNDLNNTLQGKYNDCLYSKIDIYYPEGTLEEKINKYQKDSSLSFNMYCENAYYLSWVYF